MTNKTFRRPFVAAALAALLMGTVTTSAHAASVGNLSLGCSVGQGASVTITVPGLSSAHNVVAHFHFSGRFGSGTTDVPMGATLQGWLFGVNYSASTGSSNWYHIDSVDVSATSAGGSYIISGSC